jgi:two-component system cell cycle response regulator CtrA
MRVLLVENDLAVASTLQSFFAAQSLRIEAADTGKDALELLRHYQYDIVVLNLALPDMDGTRMISRIRASGIATPFSRSAAGAIATARLQRSPPAPMTSLTRPSSPAS